VLRNLSPFAALAPDDTSADTSAGSRRGYGPEDVVAAAAVVGGAVLAGGAVWTTLPTIADPGGFAVVVAVVDCEGTLADVVADGIVAAVVAWSWTTTLCSGALAGVGGRLDGGRRRLRLGRGRCRLALRASSGVIVVARLQALAGLGGGLPIVAASW